MAFNNSIPPWNRTAYPKQLILRTLKNASPKKYHIGIKKINIFNLWKQAGKKKKKFWERMKAGYILYIWGGGGVSHDAAVPDKEGREDALKDARL